MEDILASAMNRENARLEPARRYGAELAKRFGFPPPYIGLIPHRSGFDLHVQTDALIYAAVQREVARARGGIPRRILPPNPRLQAREVALAWIRAFPEGLTKAEVIEAIKDYGCRVFSPTGDGTRSWSAMLHTRGNQRLWTYHDGKFFPVASLAVDLAC
jgi:hypothetical protein